MTEVLRDDGDDGVCMMARCTVADYLPTRCGNCGKRFCTAHVAPHAHACQAYARTNAQTVECPLCMRPVAVRAGESPDYAVGKHMELGCAPQAAQKAAETRLNMCSVHTCTRNEVQTITCDFCRQVYCVEHRHANKHACRAKPTTPPPAAASSSTARQPSPETETSSTTPPKKKVPLYVPLAQQVPRNDAKSAMRLPPNDGKGLEAGHALVLAHAFAPLAPGKKPRSVAPAFVSLPPSASIGRILDGICARLDIPNDNHLVRDDAQKLWLHVLPARPGGIAVCLPPSMTVRECVESFGSAGSPTGAARIIIARGNDLPVEIATDPDVAASAAAQLPRGGTAVAAASAANAPAAGGPSSSAPKKKDDGCVTA